MTGREELLIAKPAQGNARLLDVSRDGMHIVYSAGKPSGTAAGEASALPPVVLWFWSKETGSHATEVPGDAKFATSPLGLPFAWIADGVVKVQDLQGAVLTASTMKNTLDVLFDPTGSRLIAFSGDAIEFIDARNPAAVHRTVFLPSINSADFNESGTKLAVTSSTGAAWIIDASTGAIERMVHESGLLEPLLIGDTLLTKRSKDLLAWPATVSLTMRLNEPLGSWKSSSNGRHWLTTRMPAPTTDKEGTSTLWGESRDHREVGTDAVFSPDGNMVAWSDDEAIHVEGLAPGIAGRIIKKTAKDRTVMALGNTGALLLENEESRVHEYFVVPTDSEREKPLETSTTAQGLRELASCGKGYFLGLDTKSELHRVDPATGEAKAIVKWPSWGSIRCAPDSSEYVLGRGDGAPLIGNLDTGKPPTPWALTAPTGALALLGPNGHRALLSEDGAVEMSGTKGNLVSVAEPGSLEGAGYPSGTAFSPDGTRLCLAAGHFLWLFATDGRISRRLNVDDTIQIRERTGFRFGCGFSPDGKRVVAAYQQNAENSIRFFPDDLETGAAPLVNQLRSLVKQTLLPIDNSPIAVAARALDESTRLSRLGREAAAIAALDAALPHSPPNSYVTATMYRNRGVLSARVGDIETSLKFFRLYLPMSADHEREKIKGLIAKFEAGLSDAGTPAAVPTSSPP
jgi:WD40 repeat protein